MAGAYFGEVGGLRPRIAPDAFVAPGVVVVGGVSIGARSSVWYGSVLRADDEEVVIGEGCNVQDLCLMHADPGYPAVLEDGVSVGHRAIVHGARVERGSLVGMGAVLLNGVVVGSGSVVAAGAVVTPGTGIPPGSLVAGVPAKVLREAREADRRMIHHTAQSYLRKSGLHREARPLTREEVEAG